MTNPTATLIADFRMAAEESALPEPQPAGPSAPPAPITRIPTMTTRAILPSRNEDFGFYRTLTVCPHRDRRSAEVWSLASRLIADAICAKSEDDLIGVRDFLDSQMGRHFADDVVGHLTSRDIALETAIALAIRRWQDWRSDRKTEREHGIPAGLPYLTGWVQHFAVTAAMLESD